jgi:hypothetical protein
MNERNKKMQTPPPVNLSALKGILANAKKVMNKVEGDKPSIPSNRREQVSESYDNQPIYNESDEREPVYENYTPTQTPTMGIQNYTPEQVMASGLPDNVKQLMLKNPIPQLQGPPSKFSLEDMGDLVEKPQRARVNESVNGNSNMITVSTDQLQAMIKEGIANYFKEDYEKKITEAAIKKTISVLIKEGKLNVKK